jgi:sulfate/thiosulfate transport system substrate-binding protein
LNRVKVLSLTVGLLVLVASLVGCGGSSSSGSSGGSGSNASAGGKVNLVAYSTPEASYAKLIPAFNNTPQGKGVTFTQSYGASGDQSRAVEAGQPADVVHFALTPDIERLVGDKIVASNWDSNQYKGIVANSVVVFVVRKGNPKNITTWDDLTKPGVQVITPNPFTSGGARWNIMAAYGSELKEGKTPAQAQAYLNSLFHNVPVQDDKASAALQTFIGGKGDVLLAYEQDAKLAEAAGEPIQIVYPPSTILIQTPLATTVKSSAAGKAFAKWMWTPQAQDILAQTGYRSVIPSVASKYASDYPTVNTFTIDSLGGWDEVADKFFDPDTGIMAKIEKSLGVSTSK